MTEKKIDRELLLSEADAHTVAEYLGMEIAKKGSNYFIHCPGHKKRIGKEDNKIGNCYLVSKGYVCKACGTYINMFDMVMEYTGCNYPEALRTVAEACGGVSIFEMESSQKEIQLPLSSSDLELLGLKAPGNGLSLINISDVKEEVDEDVTVKEVDEEFFYFKKSSQQSLLFLFKTNKPAYDALIKNKAKAAMNKYQNAIEAFCDRDAPKANMVFDLFNEEGSLSDDVFFGLKNIFQKRYWRAKEIYESYT